MCQVHLSMYGLFCILMPVLLSVCLRKLNNKAKYCTPRHVQNFWRNKLWHFSPDLKANLEDLSDLVFNLSTVVAITVKISQCGSKTNICQRPDVTVSHHNIYSFSLQIALDGFGPIRALIWDGGPIAIEDTGNGPWGLEKSAAFEARAPSHGSQVSVSYERPWWEAWEDIARNGTMNVNLSH